MKRFEVMGAEDTIKLFPHLGSKWDKYPFWWAIVETLSDGSKRFVGKDGGSPEDQLLVRDWDWVVEALNAAYDRGYNDSID